MTEAITEAITEDTTEATLIITHLTGDKEAPVEAPVVGHLPAAGTGSSTAPGAMTAGPTGKHSHVLPSGRWTARETTGPEQVTIIKIGTETDTLELTETEAGVTTERGTNEVVNIVAALVGNKACCSITQGLTCLVVVLICTACKTCVNWMELGLSEDCHQRCYGRSLSQTVCGQAEPLYLQPPCLT